MKVVVNLGFKPGGVPSDQYEIDLPAFRVPQADIIWMSMLQELENSIEQTTLEWARKMDQGRRTSNIERSA